MAAAITDRCPIRGSSTCCSPRGSGSRCRCSGSRCNARGCRAASYTGSQAGIITDTQHGQAKIVKIRPKRILEALADGQRRDRRRVPGAVAASYEITTLGRGGSDTTARRDGGGARRRGLRDLHRRRRRVHRRPAHRAERAQDRARSATRRCSSSRRPARRCCSRGRSSSLGGTASRSTSARRSPTSPARGSDRRRTRWKAC